MKRLAEILVVGISAFVVLPMTALSQPVTWLPFQGGNGHSYEVIAVAGGIRWSDASLAATNRGGYLATATSSGENSFIFSLAREQTNVWFNGWGPWLGGYQAPGSPEPAGGWAWITGEPFVFQNWVSGQPNNSGGVEDRIHFGGMAGPSEVWNDLPQNGTNFARGYVVEFDPPGAVLTLVASATGDISPPQASGAPVTNGNFVIYNCCPFSPTGDGKDEFTLWTFDFSADPNLPFFLEPTELSSAILSLTLAPGASPIVSDSVRIESFPEIRAPVLRTLPLGVITNIQVDLLAYYSPTDLLNFLRDTGGAVAMIYQKDALVSYAELRLTRPDLRVRIRLRLQDGALQICWNSELNKPYQVQYSAALGEPWMELSSGVLGNGTTNCINTRQVLAQRFYRVLRLAQP